MTPDTQDIWWTPILYWEKLHCLLDIPECRRKGRGYPESLPIMQVGSVEGAVKCLVGQEWKGVGGLLRK